MVGRAASPSTASSRRRSSRGSNSTSGRCGRCCSTARRGRTRTSSTRPRPTVSSTRCCEATAPLDDRWACTFQMVRRYGDALLVNPGSVGLPFAEPAPPMRIRRGRSTGSCGCRSRGSGWSRQRNGCPGAGRADPRQRMCARRVVGRPVVARRPPARLCAACACGPAYVAVTWFTARKSSASRRTPHASASVLRLNTAARSRLLSR